MGLQLEAENSVTPAASLVERSDDVVDVAASLAVVDDGRPHDRPTGDSRYGGFGVSLEGRGDSFPKPRLWLPWAYW